MVDILLATYNGGRYLRRQLDSLMGQSYRDFRIFARDDGSADDTCSILEEYAGRYGNQLKVTPAAGGAHGAKENFFALTGCSDAEYTMFCDQDDVWEENKVELTLHAIRQAEKKHSEKMPLLAHTDLTVVDEAMRTVNPSFMRMQKLNPGYCTLNRLVAQNNITGCTVMVNRALRGMIRYNEAALMHDWWMGLAAAAFGKIIYLPEQTVKYRQHAANEVGAKDAGAAGYVVEKMQDKQGVRQSIANTYAQAEAFLEAYDGRLSVEQKTMLRQYVGLRDKNIVRRFATMNRYHFYKNGLARKIGQLIFG